MKGPHLGEAQEFVRAPGTPKISLELATDLCNSPLVLRRVATIGLSSGFLPKTTGAKTGAPSMFPRRVFGR